jgi:hypothetical protein
MTLPSAARSNGNLYFKLTVVSLLTKLANNLFFLPAQVTHMLSNKIFAKATSLQLASCLFLSINPKVVIFKLQIEFSRL